MKYILTLIGKPDSHALDSTAIARAIAVLDNAGSPCWLAPQVACDIPFDGPAPSQALAAVRHALNACPLDLVAQPADGRRKKLLLADMDSTIIEQECLDELAAEAGFGDKVARITRRAMAGDIEFEPALRERVALLKGKPLSLLEHVWRTRIHLAPGARQLVATMRAHGATTVLVSGGFTYFTGKVAEAAGFDHHRANVLLHENNRLTGTVKEPILGRDAKRRLLQEMCTVLNLTHRETLVAGDGANDLDMIGDAGLGVAYHAKPVLAAAAPACIKHGDLTALLYIQGYTAGDIVTS